MQAVTAARATVEYAEVAAATACTQEHATFSFKSLLVALNTRGKEDERLDIKMIKPRPTDLTMG